MGNIAAALKKHIYDFLIRIHQRLFSLRRRAHIFIINFLELFLIRK